MNIVPENDEQLLAAVSERYARTAQQVLSAGTFTASGCCGSGCCTTTNGDAITSNLYSSAELGELPVAAALASLGCGNPNALAELRLGEKVLDLGSGGGVDVLLSARRVGSTGFAYGLDMTDAMLELAERNRIEAKVENVRFLKGVIEDIPSVEGPIAPAGRHRANRHCKGGSRSGQLPPYGHHLNTLLACVQQSLQMIAPPASGTNPSGHCVGGRIKGAPFVPLC